jgi:hypothetical protein
MSVFKIESVKDNPNDHYSKVITVNFMYDTGTPIYAFKITTALNHCCGLNGVEGIGNMEFLLKNWEDFTNLLENLQEEIKSFGKKLYWPTKIFQITQGTSYGDQWGKQLLAQKGVTKVATFKNHAHYPHGDINLYLLDLSQ